MQVKIDTPYTSLDFEIVNHLADNFGQTAGDIALSFNNERCYNIIRDAGIRSGLDT